MKYDKSGVKNDAQIEHILIKTSDVREGAYHKEFIFDNTDEVKTYRFRVGGCSIWS